MKVLIVTTSHNKLGNTGKLTGLWLEEAVAPFYVLQDAGAEIDIVSIKGGEIPLDPISLTKEYESEFTRRYFADDELQKVFRNTISLIRHCEEPKQRSNLSRDFSKSEEHVMDHFAYARDDDDLIDSYDVLYLPGGHGTMWDYPENQGFIEVIEDYYAKGKIVASVCHGPCALVNAKKPNGEALVKGHKVTSFTNAEEEEIELSDAMPFLIESEFKRLGAEFIAKDNWAENLVIDQNLITGQNPQACVGMAEAILRIVKERRLEV